VTHLFIGAVRHTGKMLLEERQQVLVFRIQTVQQRAIDVGNLGLGAQQHVGGAMVARRVFELAAFDFVVLPFIHTHIGGK
jgi:hypothetical protein